MTEDELIAGIGERLRDVPSSRVLLGIGDDAAAWQPSRSNRSVVTTDALVEGVHFTRDVMSAADAGRRALASNLSDVAAMGARPVLATVALGFPSGTDPAWILDAYEGIARLAAQARCAIAGGDVTRAPAIVFSITVIGEVRASNLKTRSGGRPGDVVAVTGPLGAAAAGVRVALDFPEHADDVLYAEALRAFRRPAPRLREGRWLGASRHVRAMMDVSDGVSTDLARMCAASGVGARIRYPDVPAVVHEVANLSGDDPFELGLSGGEDFELLVAIEKRAFRHLASRFAAHFGKDLIAIGRLTAEPGIELEGVGPIAAAGWDHLETQRGRGYQPRPRSVSPPGSASVRN